MSRPRPLVKLAVDDGVAVVELNRPERRNALTGPMLDELAQAVDAASADDAVQVLVLCGAGGAFCSGLDLDAYNAEPPPPWLATAAESSRAAHAALAGCAVPIVAALERYAINGGAALALAADLIVAGETAWLQVGEMIQGLAAPMNAAWLSLRHSPGVAGRVLYSAERFAGPELLAMGIAHQVRADAEVRSTAEALARRIASSPEGSTRRAKAALRALYGIDPVARIHAAAEAYPTGPGFRPSQAPSFDA